MFVGAHSLATVWLLQAAANAPASAGVGVVRGLAAVFALPLLLPLIASDPDGDRMPRWFQFASVALNSLAWWAVGVLIAVLRRRHAARAGREARGFEVGPVGRGGRDPREK